ncbi:hypothetical protein F0P96_13420 [Hymenobacter busanensis]|uniref:Uncharacterized protein n=1 Tax=Hymenobacter busanensis TaxID=2607656 RepID=A0A7L4ZVY7_9BACT|nr:hypothetical protein [Hymenobacter busanensis]KAA9332465.1 hypothetical protein F0P96_13420 [Hymenobacter busanensis]QHJ07197.1 hypothetical protein GUY19_07850 [Hymenobacter busanensis]
MLFSASGLTAQPATPPLLDPKRVPLTAKKPADFVPAGWQLEQQLSGNLNADARPDRVLMLVEKATINDNSVDRNRALLVLLAQPDGSLKRVGVGPKALYCTGCFGALAGPEGGTPELSFDRGSLLVEHMAGSRFMTVQTQRFRYETASGRGGSSAKSTATPTGPEGLARTPAPTFSPVSSKSAKAEWTARKANG